MKRERRAFICLHPSHEVPERQFIGPNDPEPRCPQGHGKMARQLNVPYVKPDAEPEVVGARPAPKRKPKAKPKARRAAA